LESLRSERDLLALCAAIGPERAVFSLDLRNGKPLTEVSTWRESQPIELIDVAVNAGFARLIVLDLARVGVRAGVSTRSLCTVIRKRYPRLEITSGGGVRDRRDLTELAAAGCDAALVASALHSGSLSRQDLPSFC
jgi:phosphoribosylformimino-5-aminoimidazole carboxamide ribotide isomerase